MSQSTFWDGEEADNPGQPLGEEAPKLKSPLPSKPPRRNFRIQSDVETQSVKADEVETRAPMIPMTAEFLAAQLVTLWKQGTITGVDDPETLFYAKLILETGGVVVDKKAIALRTEKD